MLDMSQIRSGWMSRKRRLKEGYIILRHKKANVFLREMHSLWGVLRNISSHQVAYFVDRGLFSQSFSRETTDTIFEAIQDDSNADI